MNDLSVRTCVGRSVCPVHCGKTADRFQMPFGIIGRMCPEMRQVVRFGDQSTEGVLLSANLWCTIVTNGDFMAYVCDSASTRPSSQITFDRLVVIVIIISTSDMSVFCAHWHYAVIYQCLYISQTLLVPARHTNLSFFWCADTCTSL